ncbi:DNA replication and repair protein recF [Candidatus Photodesmus blepharus]|uniref:DNA replication and repair protein RecF n=1 Tax=Candidatus Photodesmus blepharonis TaxID=1179155 RepID=A0A084CNT2_9GAMM|nr:DNA replication/repair protein RecF [Candidatus Photodesmus blepharus]KEY91461.1 DNA replication and repair protein recF [Candidatus Photodesmus blepharus]
MPLTRLIIHQFRNIKSCDIELETGFNFLVGPNASGKTSLLEAIYMLGYGRSFKGVLTRYVIQNECDELFVHGRFLNTLQCEIPIGIHERRNGTKEIKIRGQSGQKVVQLAQVLPLQLIHPEGFDLLVDAPKYRRAFIDWGVFHIESEFYSVWSRFKRLNKQRNALLKVVSNYRELSYWDQEMARLSENISIWRGKYIEKINVMVKCICNLLLPEFDIELKYYQGWEKNMLYKQILERSFERDQSLGYTLNGPNKADLKIKVDKTSAKDVLSRGQLKLMVCALRIAQGQYLTQMTGKPCIYLIDDFASELDSQRRKYLADCLKATGSQVFVSSISESQIFDMYDSNDRIFNVKSGVIEQG